jgi:hypothetical protein
MATHLSGSIGSVFFLTLARLICDPQMLAVRNFLLVDVLGTILLSPNEALNVSTFRNTSK